jgi:hypothetical protein
VGGTAALQMGDSSVGILGREIEYLNAVRNLPFDSSLQGYIFGQKAAVQTDEVCVLSRRFIHSPSPTTPGVKTCLLTAHHQHHHYGPSRPKASFNDF